MEQPLMSEQQIISADRWGHRARLEAVAILDGVGVNRSIAYSDAVSLLAFAWLQGFNLGCHATLGEAEKASQRLQADLT